LHSQRKAYESCLRKLDNLLELKISSENRNGSLISDEEYAKKKGEFLKEKSHLEEILNDTSGRVKKWLDITERALNFACYARYWFKNGTPEEKTQILQALGSNLTLKDKKLLFNVKKPFTLLEKISSRVPEIKPRFEPEKLALNKGKIEDVYSQNPILRRVCDNVRTCIMNSLDSINIPQFEIPH